ncbi:MAG TPA: FmdB family zinc ribbon protein [Vicinamibacterales bacterium]
MPLYEYECDNNGHRFEVIQKFSDPPIQTCPTCGGPVHKLISSPAFQFKGSGWYVTDYARKDSGGGKGSAETGEKEKTESKDKASGTSSEKDSGAKKTESTDTKSGT